MKRTIIILTLFLSSITLRTFNANINNYSFPKHNWVTLIQGIANHYNQDFWLIKEIFDICLTYDVDPILMVSLIKVESSFIPTALSRKNAYGYCQITPIANEDVDPSLNRYNKRDNIILGVKVIKKLLARFNGNLITTLRYYNSGHDYNEKGEQYAENIKKEYEELVSLYVRDEESHGVIYRKEHF